MLQHLESWLLWTWQCIVNWPGCFDMLITRGTAWVLAAVLAATGPAESKGLADIDHVILFMQGWSSVSISDWNII